MSRDQWILIGLALYFAAVFCAWALVASGAEPRRPAGRTARTRTRPAEHAHPDCTGVWAQSSEDAYLVWCSRCGASGYGLEAAGDAVAENYWGRRALAETQAGMSLLAAERKERAA